MQTKHICVLIHIWTKGKAGAPLNRLKPFSKIFLLTFIRRCFFCGSFILFLSCFVLLSCTSVCWCLVVTCWERADLLTLVCDVQLRRRRFPIGILGQVWCLIVSIPDLCPLSYLDTNMIKPNWVAKRVCLKNDFTQSYPLSSIISRVDTAQPTFKSYQGPQSAHQRNAIWMGFHWRAKSDPILLPLRGGFDRNSKRHRAKSIAMRCLIKIITTTYMYCSFMISWLKETVRWILPLHQYR